MHLLGGALPRCENRLYEVGLEAPEVSRTTFPFAVKLSSALKRKSMSHDNLLSEALDEAQLGLKEGGLPIGSVLADAKGHVIARGHNLRVQTADPTAHAELVCIRNAGRRRDWNRLTLVSTLSPCIMCTGTSLLFKIPQVVIGENQNFLGAESLFIQHGVRLTILNDVRCIELMRAFIAAHPDLWQEDIGD
jgi:cytosine/creatinine deaminase